MRREGGETVAETASGEPSRLLHAADRAFCKRAAAWVHG
jgi:hypothetical protein